MHFSECDVEGECDLCGEEAVKRSQIEEEIMKEIFKIKGKVTLIIIAHRMSTVRYCDRIYKIRNGKIDKYGKFEDILNEYE